MGDANQQVQLRKTSGSKRNLIIGIILALLIAISGVGFGLYNYVSANLTAVSSDSTAQAENVTIPKGAATGKIAELLYQARLIKNPSFFSIYARYKNYDGQFRPGVYSLKPNQDLESLMLSLKKGPAPLHFTIPEGFTTKQIVDLLVQEKLIDKNKFMELVKSYDFGFDFLQGLPPSEARLEGFLFPDTYEIEQGTNEEGIIRLMLKRFEQELTPEIKTVLKQKGMSVADFVTLGSLIEREAKQPEDRPVISQVFQKRLQIGMPLQSCASVQFVLGTSKPVLSLKDLEVNSPYNTYKHPGLPPGPIANPGKAALLAAAYPAQTDYLYFVAKADGYHAFAKTYQEHLNNVKKYE